MTKLEKIKIPNDIHLNIKNTFDFIDENIPKKYSREVFNLLPNNKKVDLSYIRQVKNERIKSKHILVALYRVAQFNKLQKQF